MITNELSSGIKNVAEIVRKAENLELYAMLLDLYSKALDLQEENAKLKAELSDKSEHQAIAAKVLRHPQPFITLKDDDAGLMYCAQCWDSEGKLIQLNTEPRPATFTCPKCKNEGIYDPQKHAEYEKSRRPKGPRITVL